MCTWTVPAWRPVCPGSDFQSGKDYQYEVYPIDASFQPLPGNHIYAKQAEDGSWIPVYIAQTRDLHQRPWAAASEPTVEPGDVRGLS